MSLITNTDENLNKIQESFNIILTYPCISAKTVDPALSMMASTSSTTSKYASLLVYFTPVRRHGTLDNWPLGNVALTL